MINISLTNDIVEIEHLSEDKSISIERFHRSRIKRVTLCNDRHVCMLETDSHSVMITNDLLDNHGFADGESLFNFLTTLIGA